jgi:PEP-CTERM motif
MRRLSSWTASTVTRLSTWVTMAVAIGSFVCTGPMADAASVVVEISGSFGSFTFGNQPAPLNGGSFSGTVTFPSLPGPNQTVGSATDPATTSADVNFYDSTGHLLFTVGGSGSYDQFTAGPSGYESLSVDGGTSIGSTPVSVSALVLTFDNWSFGSPTGTVQPYGAGTPPDFGSAIQYTYVLPYSNPVVLGQASVPEPSTIALSLVGMVGVLVYARCYRRAAGGTRVVAS